MPSTRPYLIQMLYTSSLQPGFILSFPLLGIFDSWATFRPLLNICQPPAHFLNIFTPFYVHIPPTFGQHPAYILQKFRPLPTYILLGYIPLPAFISPSPLPAYITLHPNHFFLSTWYICIYAVTPLVKRATSYEMLKRSPSPSHRMVSHSEHVISSLYW